VIDAEDFDHSLLVAFTEDSVSIIQAAARRQIEHWMMCMVDLKEKERARRPFPVLDCVAVYAADLSTACIAFASFWKISKLAMRSSDCTPTSSRMV
jgi:hypothetical protein